MKIPKEFEERLKHLHKTLITKFDVLIYVSRYDEDEAVYKINRGPYTGIHHIFREEEEGEASFQARMHTEVAERSPKSKIIIEPYEEYLRRRKMDHIIESESPENIRYKEEQRKLRRERIERTAAANNPAKQNP
jgi:hypothetical protein